MYLSVKSLKRLSLSFLILINVSFSFSQSFNNNPQLGFINHDVPKSPESSSFQKYGDIPVGEYTGTASIAVPLYSIQNKDLQLPINLSYHASGIKVSQEATWVGLGWDLVPGGRITLQIRGGYDKYTDQFYQGGPWGSQAEKMVKYIASQVAGYPKNSSIAWGCGGSDIPPGADPVTYIGDPASYCDIWHNHPVLNFSSLDLQSFLYTMSKNAALEPDIYHVNVLGKSLSFYKQQFTNKFIIMNENYLYKIEEIQENNKNGWKITDDNGISYFFLQEEKTHYMTPINGLFPDMTSSWLLTKIVSPSTDVVNFTYTNYGSELTAPELVESETTRLGEFVTDPFEQNSNRYNSSNFFYVYPQYLTQIESKNTLVNFNLGFRDDIGGLGARKLEEIVVKSKITNEDIRHIKFNYEYFMPNGSHPLYMDPNMLEIASHGNTTATQRLGQRLKLTSVNIGGELSNVFEQTYRFLYNPLLLPNKVSTAQDHWGFFNNVNNINQFSNSISFTPTLQSLVEEGIISIPYPQGTDASLSGHANRSSDSNSAQANMLTSVIYPTGGYSNFEYELHQSYLKPTAPNFKGGGLRIRRISNFSADSKPTSILNYDYRNDNQTEGTYLGSIDYFVAQINHGFDVEQHSAYDEVVRTLHSNGNLNMAGSTVVYGKVKKTYVDYKSGNNNYTSIKYHNVRESTPLKGYGDASMPTIEPSKVQTFVPEYMHLPPTPEGYTAGIGKLYMEKHLNNMGELVQLTRNYYKHNMILDSLYSLKVREYTKPTVNIFNPQFDFVFEPIHSYFTTLDSSITETYFQGSKVTQKNEMKYNTAYQVSEIVSTSSDKGSFVKYFTKPLSYQGLPSGGYQYLITKNVLNAPIEEIYAKKGENGLEQIIAGSYFKYDDNANIIETNQLEIALPIPISQFQKSFYSTVTDQLVMDSRYQTKQKAEYYPAISLLKQLTLNGKNQAFIYDVNNENLIANASNSLFTDIAYTSFENNETGNWTINAGTINSDLAHTGNRSLNNNVGNTLIATISTAGNYTVSYWSNSGNLSVNSIFPVAKQTINGWTYYELVLPLGTGGTITLEGNATIDELRLYPSDALMTSYTYKPLVGITSLTDPKAQTTYYEYNNFNKLKNIKDLDGNILKSFDNNYINIDNIIPSTVFFNEEKTVSVAKQCPIGQTGSLVPYTVPENKYTSFISQADANQLAQNDIDLNAQNNANNLGNCTLTPIRPTFSLSYYLPVNRQFLISITDNVSNQTESYTVSGSGSLDNIPGGTGYISINEISYTGSYSFYLDSLNQTGAYVQFGILTTNSSMSLYVQEL